MKNLIIGALAVAGVALSLPASAQGVYVGAGPVGVGVGVGPGYGYGGGYGYDSGYYDRGYGPGYRSYAYSGHCRVVRQDINGHIRRVRHCR